MSFKLAPATRKAGRAALCVLAISAAAPSAAVPRSIVLPTVVITAEQQKLDRVTVTGKGERQPTYADAIAIVNGLYARQERAGLGGGETVSDSAEDSTDPSDNKDSSSGDESCGNPIQIVSGNKVERELDFATVHEFGLDLTRTYNLNATVAGLFGPKWSTPFDVRAAFEGSGAGGLPATVRLWRSDGSNLKLNLDPDGRWYIEGSTSRQSHVWRLPGGQYQYRDATGRIETYAAGGSVLRIVNPQGIAWNFTYGNPDWPVSATTVNPTLQRVTHAGGRSMQFTWGQVAGVWVVTSALAPNGQTYGYGYLTSAHLASVTYPPTPRTVAGAAASDVVTYHMNTAAGGGQLLGKSINGVRYSTFGYDGAGRANLSEHAGGVERYTFTRYTAGQTTVTNPLGQSTTYYSDAEGDIIGTNRSPSTYCPAAAASVVKDPAARRTVSTDLDGHKTETTKDAEGNIIKVVRGFESATPHETTYTWDLYPKRLRSMRTPTQLIEYEFTASNRVQSLSVTNLSAAGQPGQRLSTTYAYYDANADGLPETIVIDGPVAGSGDAVTQVYSNGELIEERRPSGTTTFANLDGLGQPGSITNANGIVTTLQYDARGRFHAATTAGVTARLAYDVLGNVLESQSSGQPVLYRSYDAARRLMQVKEYEAFPAAYNGSGNPDDSTLWLVRDAASNVTENRVTRVVTQEVITCGTQPECTGDEETQTVTAVATFRSSFTDYDELSRVRAERGNTGQALRYNYTHGGQVLKLTDGSGPVVAQNEYDEHKRLKQTTDALSGITRYGYDVEGRLASVTDPRGAVTSYAYDGLGLLQSTNSPDSGTTTYSYDAAGQRIGELRADGGAVSIGYQADGRVSVLQASRGGLSQTRTLGYDTCANGRGRLCSLVESSGERVDYAHTALGALASQSHTIAGQVFTTQWGYNAAGQVQTLTYPNGVVATYTWADGKVRAIDVTVAGVTRRVVGSALYDPFGPVAGYVDASNRARNFAYDRDGRLYARSDAAQTQGLSYDARNLIRDISGSSLRSMSYDTLGRLSSVNQAGVTMTLAHDANGNRTQAGYSSSPGLPVSYATATGGNRLLTTTWNGSTRSLSYDAAGNLLRDQRSATQTDCHSHDAFGRVAGFARYAGNVACQNPGMSPSSQGTYRNNALNQRSHKLAAGRETRFVHGPGGELLFERSSPASTYSDKAYVWFDGQVVAMVSNNTVFSVYSDHLGRPVQVRTTGNAMVWGATLQAFDRTATTDQIGGFHIGYPGQYFDAESGLWNNWHRYYDGSVGRYTQSDPIGLAGGINTYGYVGGNPLSFIDLEGASKRAGTPSQPMFPSIGPSPSQVSGSYSTVTMGRIREITGRGRMTDMQGSARGAFNGFRGSSPASCQTSRDGSMREVSTLPNGTVIQLRDGRVDIFPPGGRPETIHFASP